MRSVNRCPWVLEAGGRHERNAGRVSIAASLLSAALVAAGPNSASKITGAEKRQAVVELAAMLRARYAIAETAEAAAKAIEGKLANGSYDSLGPAEQFADAVKTDLVVATHDKRLNFGVAPPPAPTPVPGARPDPDAEAAAPGCRTLVESSLLLTPYP